MFNCTKRGPENITENVNITTKICKKIKTYQIKTHHSYVADVYKICSDQCHKYEPERLVVPTVELY